MDLSKIGLFSGIENKMAYHGARQSVLAANVANADTPGYKPLDIEKKDFGKMVDKSGSVELSSTHPMHMSPSGVNGGFKTYAQKNTYEITPAGNEVVLEEQMLKMVQNSMDYQATTSLYQKMVKLVSDSVSTK